MHYFCKFSHFYDNPAKIFSLLQDRLSSGKASGKIFDEFEDLRNYDDYEKIESVQHTEKIIVDLYMNKKIICFLEDPTASTAYCLKWYHMLDLTSMNSTQMAKFLCDYLHMHLLIYQKCLPFLLTTDFWKEITLFYVEKTIYSANLPTHFFDKAKFIQQHLSSLIIFYKSYFFHRIQYDMGMDFPVILTQLEEAQKTLEKFSQNMDIKEFLERKDFFLKLVSIGHSLLFIDFPLIELVFCSLVKIYKDSEIFRTLLLAGNYHTFLIKNWFMETSPKYLAENIHKEMLNLNFVSEQDFLDFCKFLN